jgi:hypothetical protein
LIDPNEIDVVKIIIKPDLVAPPFAFNPLKHHLGFIRGFIKRAELMSYETGTFDLINSIGPQVTDIYCGLLSVDELIESIKSLLNSQSVYCLTSYDEWVRNSGKNYNFLDLPDGSKWTFRKGENPERYIHFHPARTNGSIRIRGTTLKTAMGLKIVAGENLSLYRDKEFINTLRQKRLQLSPVKSLSNFPAINKILDLLNENSIDDSGFVVMI